MMRTAVKRCRVIGGANLENCIQAKYDKWVPRIEATRERLRKLCASKATTAAPKRKQASGIGVGGLLLAVAVVGGIVIWNKKAKA